MTGLIAEITEAKRRREAKLRERRQWAEYQRTYERCKKIAEQVWGADLEKAGREQRATAEAMRDRTTGATDPAVTMFAPREASIPVPLFTPRDRLQFLKECTSQLMIGTERRGLTVTPEVKDAETQEAPEATVWAAIKEYQATGDLDKLAKALSDSTRPMVPEASDYGEPVQEAPAPRV